MFVPARKITLVAYCELNFDATNWVRQETFLEGEKVTVLGQKIAGWFGENRNLQMERYEAGRVGADTSCRYHRPSSTPSTATHSIIFANQYCVKLRVKASLTRIGQLDQQSCKLSLPYTSRPNYSFALFVVETLGRMQEIKRSQCIKNIQLWSTLIRILSCLCCTITCMTYPAKTHPLYIKTFRGVLFVIDQD